MGLFDRILVRDPRMVCSEGHSMSDDEFQTYDLGRTNGDAEVVDGRLSFQDGGNGRPVAMPFTGRLTVYTDCEQCPAFVQTGTLNLHMAWVEFEIDLQDGVVTDIRRISQSTAEWLAEVPSLPYMKGAMGPMSVYDAAMVRLSAVSDRTRG